jgi:hypothetical protein
MQYNLIASETSNHKLGSDRKKGIIIATNYRPVGDAARGLGSCPTGCGMLNPETGKAEDCYTKKFLVNQQVKKSWARNDDLSKFLEKGANYVRLHTSGDFFKQLDNTYVLDKEYLDSVIDFARQNPKVLFWTYTHDVIKLIEAGYSYNNNSFPDNLHITASCDSNDVMDYAIQHGYRTARVIKGYDQKLSNETLCPFDKAKHDGVKPNTNCVKCTLCFNNKHKKNIAFLLQK